MKHSVVATGDSSVCKLGVELELNRNHYGVPVLPTPRCRFRYNLDFSKSYGSASLNAIDNVPVDITLYPLGGEGMWDFISEMPPTRFVVNGQPVFICRVALNIDLFTGEESAAIVFHQPRASILSTSNFDTYCTALTL